MVVVEVERVEELGKTLVDRRVEEEEIDSRVEREEQWIVDPIYRYDNEGKYPPECEVYVQTEGGHREGSFLRHIRMYNIHSYSTPGTD